MVPRLQPTQARNADRQVTARVPGLLTGPEHDGGGHRWGCGRGWRLAGGKAAKVRGAAVAMVVLCC